MRNSVCGLLPCIGGIAFLMLTIVSAFLASKKEHELKVRNDSPIPKRMPVGTPPPPELSTPGPTSNLQKLVELLPLLKNSQGDLNNLILGIDKDGVVSDDIHSLKHTIIAGTSGWGKSVACQSLAFQLATCPQEVGLAFADMEGVTFQVFDERDRLVYPLADTIDEIEGLLSSLLNECDKRKALYKPFKIADSLKRYNELADMPLPPIVCFVDEASDLMDNSKEIETAVKSLCRRARKYGIYMILSGQEFKASTMDSSIRYQMSTKLQLKCESAVQSRMLIFVPDAVDLKVEGRGLLKRSKYPLTEIQTPFIDLASILKILETHKGVATQTPQLEVVTVLSQAEKDLGTVLAALDVTTLFGDKGIVYGARSKVAKALGIRDAGNYRPRIDKVLRLVLTSNNDLLAENG